MYKAWVNDTLQVYRQNRFKAWGIRKTRVLPDRQRIDLVGDDVKSISRTEFQVFYQDNFWVATP
jgi:hypothetical protein